MERNYWLFNESDHNGSSSFSSDYTESDHNGSSGCCVAGAERFIIPAVFGAIVVVGCFGNGLVLIVVLKNRDYVRTTTNLFILSLAAADLLFIVFCVPFHAVIYATASWPFGEAACKAVHLVQFASMLASVLTLIAMSLDRFLAIAYPLSTKHLRTPARAFAASVAIWTLAVVAASPMPVFYTVRVYGDIGPTAVAVCADDWGEQRAWKPTYFLFLFVVGYVAPLGAIVTLSALMVRGMWRLRAPARQGRRGGRSARLKRRVTRLIVVVVAVFCVCWLPSHVVWLWTNYWRRTWRNTYAFYYFRIAAHALSYANSTANPIIYALLSANFQKAFRRALDCRAAPPPGGATAPGTAAKTASSFSGSGKRTSMSRMTSV